MSKRFGEQLQLVGGGTPPTTEPLSKLRKRLEEKMAALEEAEEALYGPDTIAACARVEKLEGEITALWKAIREQEAEAMGVDVEKLPTTRPYEAWQWRVLQIKEMMEGT